MQLNVSFTDSELPELRKTLDRAMNTWEPREQPKWLQSLSDAVDNAMGSPTPQPMTTRVGHAPAHQQP